MNIVFIPEGFKLIAVSELPGTGKVESKAYYSVERGMVYFTLSDPLTESCYAFGPVELRVLKTFANVLGDVVDMVGKAIRFLEE